MTYFLEVGNLDGLIWLFLAIMLGPAIIIAIIGFAVIKKNKKAAKILFIIAATYVIVSLGICGGMLA